MSTVPSDIEIAQAAKLRPIADVAAEIGLGPDEILPYGRYKAKITPEAIAKRSPKGRLVLVTGINPTPAGEGKSTVTVGLAQALRKLGKKVVVISGALGEGHEKLLTRVAGCFACGDSPTAKEALYARTLEIFSDDELLRSLT